MSTYVVPLYVLRAKRRGYEVSVMKALMDLLGLAGGPVRPPLANAAPGGSRHAARERCRRGRRSFDRLRAQGSRLRQERRLLISKALLSLSPEP